MRSYLYHLLCSIMIVVVTTTAPVVVAQSDNPPCSMCQDAGAALAYPDRIIPFIGIVDEDNPTCRQVAEFAPDVSDDNGCALIQAQAAFCGCPESPTTPLNECSLCPNVGDAPGYPAIFTPFGDTCDELAEYLSYTSADQCDTDRVKVIKNNGFICNCPGAKPGCSLCPDESRDIANPDRVIPFFNLGANPNPTCDDLQRLASLEFDDSFADCDKVQAQAGFCGCPNIQPNNECTFCPTGVAAPNANRVAPTSDTCSELDDYFTFLDTSGCESPVTDAIRAVGYFCGCPETEPQCNLCEAVDSTLISRDRSADNFGGTCGDYDDIVSTFTADNCELSGTDRLEIFYRCCEDTEKPACRVTQNPQLCTRELLDSAGEECECYNFCDGEFVGCERFPGSGLLPSECSGSVITGCNEALVDSAAMVKLGSGTFFVTTIVGYILQAVLFP